MAPKVAVIQPRLSRSQSARSEVRTMSAKDAGLIGDATSEFVR
jgi:hypothetical protein